MAARPADGQRKTHRAIALAGALLLLGGAAPRTPSVGGASPIAIGEYLVTIGGCNDCHTVGWNQAPGHVSVQQRLTGSPVGWHGPWGTSYAVNLRLLVGRLTPEAWLDYVAAMHPRPPMPWYNMQAMSEPDLRAMYAYIHSLGPAGEAMPTPLPPGEMPKAAYIEAAPHPPG